MACTIILHLYLKNLQRTLDEGHHRKYNMSTTFNSLSDQLSVLFPECNHRVSLVVCTKHDSYVMLLSFKYPSDVSTSLHHFLLPCTVLCLSETTIEFKWNELSSSRMLHIVFCVHVQKYNIHVYVIQELSRTNNTRELFLVR